MAISIWLKVISPSNTYSTTTSTGEGEVVPFEQARYLSLIGHEVTIYRIKANFIQKSDYFKQFKIKYPHIKIEFCFEQILRGHL